MSRLDNCATVTVAHKLVSHKLISAKREKGKNQNLYRFKSMILNHVLICLNVVSNHDTVLIDRGFLDKQPFKLLTTATTP